MNTKQNSRFLIVEDDPDQMRLLTSLALAEIKSLVHENAENDVQRQILSNLQIVKVSNISSLKKAVSSYKEIFFVLLDCNIPDTKDSAAHDQLLKTDYRITGQHKSVDIITENLPGVPITMVSSLNRFQKIVGRYYKNTFDLRVNFIRKNDQAAISKNIRDQLVRFIGRAV